jgi:formylglycine-generating enzyme required for sulfatase activity
LARHDPQRWREVVRLAAAKAGRGSAASVWLLAETLCPEPVEGDPQDIALPLAKTSAWGALLAGQVLAESVDLSRLAKRDEGKRDRIRNWQLAIMRRRALPAVERALAGRSLDTLEDIRNDVMNVQEMQFCYVPENEFQTRNARYAIKTPNELQELPAFWLSRYPVTFAQWREYANLSQINLSDPRSLTGQSNAPVSFVSWREAHLFCKWLNTLWSTRLPAGWKVTLPSEFEWVRAACGDKMVLATACSSGAATINKPTQIILKMNLLPLDRYPWGDVFNNEYANTREGDIGKASAVGTYPNGRSPCGCEEMAGNIWEWTRSFSLGNNKESVHMEIRDIDNLPDDQLFIRPVAKGGSWQLNAGATRPSTHLQAGDSYSYSDVGFRIALCCDLIENKK